MPVSGSCMGSGWPCSSDSTGPVILSISALLSFGLFKILRVFGLSPSAYTRRKCSTRFTSKAVSCDWLRSRLALLFPYLVHQILFTLFDSLQLQPSFFCLLLFFLTRIPKYIFACNNTQQFHRIVHVRAEHLMTADVCCFTFLPSTSGGFDRVTQVELPIFIAFNAFPVELVLATSVSASSRSIIQTHLTLILLSAIASRGEPAKSGDQIDCSA